MLECSWRKGGSLQPSARLGICADLRVCSGGASKSSLRFFVGRRRRLLPAFVLVGVSSSWSGFISLGILPLSARSSKGPVRVAVVATSSNGLVSGGIVGLAAVNGGVGSFFAGCEDVLLGLKAPAVRSKLKIAESAKGLLVVVGGVEEAVSGSMSRSLILLVAIVRETTCDPVESQVTANHRLSVLCHYQVFKGLPSLSSKRCPSVMLSTSPRA